MERPSKLVVAVLLFVVLTGFTACSSKTDQSSVAPAKPPSAQPAIAAPASQPTTSASQPVAPPSSGNATAPASTPASGNIQTQDTNKSGLAADLIECKRKEGVLSIKIRFRNVSSPNGSFEIISSRNYASFYVTAANKKYFMLKDSEGTYLTPAADGSGYLVVPLSQGQAYTWWAKFPAPSADVTKVSIFTPLMAPFEDVPITDQ